MDERVSKQQRFKMNQRALVIKKGRAKRIEKGKRAQGGFRNTCGLNISGAIWRCRART
jgi:hypothetical protein